MSEFLRDYEPETEYIPQVGDVGVLWYGDDQPAQTSMCGPDEPDFRNQLGETVARQRHRGDPIYRIYGVVRLKKFN